MTRLALLSALCSLLSTFGSRLYAQTPALREEIRRYREQNERAIVTELADLLALRNVASNVADIRRNAAHIQGMLERRGIRSRLLEAGEAAPSVYAELLTPGATRTIVFYSHYDGQPVDSTKWLTPPWTPVLRSGPLGPGVRELPLTGDAHGRYDPESRIYARSASDDKSPIVAVLWAIDALRAARVPLSVNLKFFLEGEEEAGSEHLREILTRHRDLLRADFWIFADGPVHQNRQHSVVFGVRGDMGAQLTVYGPSRPLHSGHYGNWAPNPNVMLIHLLASMRDQDGRITVPGYYDDVRPLSDVDREAVAAAPAVEPQLVRELKLGRTEGAPRTLGEQIAQPAINVSGLAGGRTGGGGANVIVPEASAFLDLRLVPDQKPERVVQLIEDHVRRQGFHVVQSEPDSATRLAHPRVIRIVWDRGYPAVRTSLDNPGSRALLAAAEASDSDLGRKPSSVSPGRGPGYAVRDAADRQPRQQSAWRKREPAPPEPVGRDRAVRRRASAPGSGMAGGALSLGPDCRRDRRESHPRRVGPRERRPPDR